MQRSVIKDGPGTREEQARDRAKLADAHYAHGEIGILVYRKINKASELGKSIGAGCDLKDVGAVRFCQRRLGTQAARQWSGFEVMERKNPKNILVSRARKQRFKCARRTQLNIDIFGVRQKTQEQIPTFRQRKIICATFSRIARGDNDRRGLAPASPSLSGQGRHLALELIGHAAKMIESKLKKVRWLAHTDGKSEIGGGGDDANNELVRYFDRFARCHILSDSGNQARAMVAPFVACSRDDRN